jgi:hypothetical protein
LYGGTDLEIRLLIIWGSVRLAACKLSLWQLKADYQAAKGSQMTFSIEVKQ